MNNLIRRTTQMSLLFVAVSACVNLHAGATSPSQVVYDLESYFQTDNVDAMMTLYDSESVMAPQAGADAVKGVEAIRPILQGYADAAEAIDLEVRTVYRTGDTALMIVDYTMKIKGENGQLIEMSGTATDVVKQNENGEWYYLIDNPFGVALP